MADNTQSGARLKVNYYAGSDGSKLPVLNMHDSQLGVDCSFQTATDGTTRCLPSGLSVSSWYADSGCTQPVGCLVSGAGCATAPKYAISTAESGCTFTVRRIQRRRCLLGDDVLGDASELQRKRATDLLDRLQPRFRGSPLDVRPGDDPDGALSERTWQRRVSE